MLGRADYAKIISNKDWRRKCGMVEINFLDDVDDSLLKFAVIISKTNGKLVFCKPIIDKLNMQIESTANRLAYSTDFIVPRRLYGR